MQPFSWGGRQFDGSYGDIWGAQAIWYEAKSGNFWQMLETNTKALNKFHSNSNTGDQARIARSNGNAFEVISENPIPANITQWLDKKEFPIR